MGGLLSMCCGGAEEEVGPKVTASPGTVLGTGPKQDTDEEKRRKMLEAAAKRRAQEEEKRGVKTDALRYQQERQEKIEKAEEAALRAGTHDPSGLKWQVN